MKKAHVIFCSAAMAATSSFAASGEAALRAGFANPPSDVKIGCYYYWVNERVDEEGVKKDLQWMKENGITRAFLATDIRNRTRFENPWEGQQFGDCTFRSEKWWRCLRTAFRTAGELGIEMGIFNCPGWSQSGGPWVTKEDAQIAPDGTCIRFTEQALFEVVFPDGRTETWNPVSCR